jgi:hypothetical protein
MTIKHIVTCPNCGAPLKHAPRVDAYGRQTPSIFTCGTVTSPHWSPPIWGEACITDLSKEL